MTRERLTPAVTNLLVAQAVDLVVHLGWVGGTRRVTSVREITGSLEGDHIASNELWAPGPGGAAMPNVPPSESTSQALAAVGFDTRRLGRTGAIR